jgi:hypothetical protein
MDTNDKNKGGRPTDYNENMLLKAQEYLAGAHDYIDEAGKWRVKIPKAAGMALHLGVARSTLYEWAKSHAEFSDILERMNAMQEDRVIDRAIDGTYNSNIAKLLLGKHGYSEEQHLTHDAGSSLAEVIAAAAAYPHVTPERKHIKGADKVQK